MRIVPQAIAFSVSDSSQILASFKAAVARIHAKQKNEFLTGQFLQDLAVAYTEGVANAIRHGRELERGKKIQCSIKVNERAVEIRIEDHGKGFAIDRVQTPRFKKLAESGRGVFMMRQLMDSVQYRKGKTKNVLIMNRELIGADPHARDLELLYEISQAVLENPDTDSVYEIILDKAVEVFGAERASILAFDASTNRLKLVASRGLTRKLSKAVEVEPGEGIAGYVFQHSKPCLIEDIDKNPSGWRKKKGYKSRSFISAPLLVPPMRQALKPLGVINMTDRKDGRPFTRKDLKLLTTIANQASACLHMSRLWTENRDAELLRREMDIARQIQRSYLPKLPPQVKGLTAAGWCETAQSVGGDYYDWILKDPDNFYAVIADVSGHNVAAAMTMVNMRGQLKNFLSQADDPGELVTLLNLNLFEDLARNDQFITLFLLRYRPNEGKIEFANAGHRLPLILYGGDVFPLASAADSGAALGVIEREKYETKTAFLNPGAALFLYTDGVIEAANADGKRLGLNTLIQILKSVADPSPQKILSALRKKLLQFKGDSPVNDDVTVACIRRS